ncbi:MAG: divergent polysaccharide deacetylase family protein [Desulforegulaceae bacterium]|nr:divergent polysaccharide deacetylase family protein [Desulforegulaceae bacterium]
MDKKKANRNKKFDTLKKFFISIFILIFFCLISFTSFYFLFPPLKKDLKNNYIAKSSNKTISVKKPIKTNIDKKIQSEKKILYEIYNKAEEKSIPDKKSDYKGLPKICIIIDDIGFDKKNAYRLSNLGINITLSILPFSPFAKEIAKKASNSKTEFMLHIPMEPIEYPEIDPGPGALLSKMDPDQIIRTLKNDLDYLPFIKGVNNHMGSKLTANSDIMNQVFTIIKKRELFFVDSLTNPESKCIESARMFKVDFAKRDVFLDNIQDINYINRQIQKLKNIAFHRGYAVGIGHPYDSTIKSLEKNIAEMKKEFEFVKASSVVKQVQ